MKKTILTVGLLVVAGILAFSILMLLKVIPYLSFERGIHFLSTKTEWVLDNKWFLAGFYIHITSSLWVMAGGVVQFVPAIFHKKPILHQWIGKIYVGSVLLLAAPSGLILAFYANGGLPAKVGFSLQCLIWWFTTYLAWQEIVQRNWLLHIEWMIRCYAVTLAAMSLRLESYALYYWFGTKPIETYLTVTWLSWTGNLFLAELSIRLGLAKYLLASFTKNDKIPTLI
jgi:hypothetical protein